MMVRFSVLLTNHIITQEIFHVLISGRGLVDPRIMVRSERLCQLKIPFTPSGIEEATAQIVVLPINHCATAVP